VVGRRDVPKARTCRSHYCFKVHFHFQQSLFLFNNEPIRADPLSVPGCEAEYKIVTIEACDVVPGKNPLPEV
jgi:hypothetical protein